METWSRCVLIGVLAGMTYRRLIPDSGGAEERERVLSSGEGEGLGVTTSSSVSSLRKNKKKPHHDHQPYPVLWDLLRLTYKYLRVPSVVRQLLLQHEDFGFKLVPLVEDVPQFLQGETGPVGVLWVQTSARALVAQCLLARRDKRMTK